jgi:hypothetical protein
VPDFETVAQQIETRLRANWLTTPVVSQNVSYEPDGTPFVYFEILGGNAFFATVGVPGGNLHRNVGIIQCHVFVPLNTGDGLAMTYARQIGSIFKGKVLDGVSYNAATIGGGEAADDYGNFWRRTVTIEFLFDELA